MFEDPSSVKQRDQRQTEADLQRERKFQLDKSRQVRESILAAAGKVNPLLSLEDLDLRLLAPKINDVVREMHGRIAGEERRAINESSAGYLNRVLSFHEGLLEEWAERLYTVYCEVCEMQNRSVSPGLVRAIRDTPIATLIAARRSSVIAEARLRGMRINDHPNPHALSEFSRRIDRLAVRWNSKMESDAAALEYRIERNRSSQSRAVEVSPRDLPPLSSVAEQEFRREVVIKKVQNPHAHRILSFDEAALYFKVHPGTIKRWRRQAKLRSGVRRGSVTIESILQLEKKRSRKPREG